MFVSISSLCLRILLYICAFAMTLGAWSIAAQFAKAKGIKNERFEDAIHLCTSKASKLWQNERDRKDELYITAKRYACNVEDRIIVLA